MNKLLILSNQEQTYLELIAQAKLQDLEITDDPGQANLVLADPPRLVEHLDSFSNLDWVQSTFAGIDALTDDKLRRDYQLTNIKGIFGQLIAEYVLGYTIGYYRNFEQYRHQQNNKHWEQLPYPTLLGKRMVILGTGSIGSYLANAVRALGIETIGVNRTGIPPMDSPFDVTFHNAELPRALEMADIVVSTLPNTKDTLGLLNKETLSHCEQALLFNVGRGEALDVEGLLHAIRNGSVEHAFLDVFITEPISQQSPFWEHPNITVTPHVAAVSFPEQAFEIFAENYQRWQQGFSLINQIDFEKGY
ncbi:D-2-hydroxyacid dehydrogenase [Aliivibrio kagoshimensis]|uniref:D-2-hydroxyacid dehydrogenase n=1 Tax=Aliivibrio kagoshimensis TaxID=2910230 RepID=UPI003D0AD833